MLASGTTTAKAVARYSGQSQAIAVCIVLTELLPVRQFKQANAAALQNNFSAKVTTTAIYSKWTYVRYGFLGCITSMRNEE